MARSAVISELRLVSRIEPSALLWGYGTYRRKIAVYFAFQIQGAAVMPRYFFHVRDGWNVHEDLEGIDLQDPSAVENEAITAAKEIIAEALLGGRPAPLGYRFEVVDEQGKVILDFPFERAANEAGRQP
jgi:hypothetical protein